MRRDDKTFFFKRNSFTPKFTPFYTKNNITIVVIVHPQKIFYFCALCLPLNYFRVPKTKAIQGHIGVDSKVSLSPRKNKKQTQTVQKKTKTKPVNSSAATPKKKEQERGSGNRRNRVRRRNEPYCRQKWVENRNSSSSTPVSISNFATLTR